MLDVDSLDFFHFNICETIEEVCDILLDLRCFGPDPLGEYLSKKYKSEWETGIEWYGKKNGSERWMLPSLLVDFNTKWHHHEPILEILRIKSDDDIVQEYKNKGFKHIDHERMVGIETSWFIFKKDDKWWFVGKEKLDQEPITYVDSGKSEDVFLAINQHYEEVAPFDARGNDDRTENQNKVSKIRASLHRNITRSHVVTATRVSEYPRGFNKMHDSNIQRDLVQELKEKHGISTYTKIIWHEETNVQECGMYVVALGFVAAN